MAEPTTSLTFTNLQAEVGYYLGYGRTTGSWSTAQTTEVESVIQKGLRAFYDPPPVGNSEGHDWSFLYPTTSIFVWPTITATLSGDPDGGTTLTATASVFYPSMVGKTVTMTTGGATYTISSYTSATVVEVSTTFASTTSGDTFTVTSDNNYNLPDSFGGLDGVMTYNANEGWRPIEIVSETQIRERRMREYSSGGNSGYVLYAAARPKAVDMTTGQRFELMVWPNAAAIYELSYRYRVLASKLDATNLYHLGGTAHAETMLASCIAQAALYIDDEVAERKAYYMERLAASIAYDSRNQTKSEFLGYNADDSDIGREFQRHYRVSDVTFNDTLY